MNRRYVAEISYGIPTHYGFSYVDTEDGLADFLFAHLKIDVKPDVVFHNENDPYRIVMCKIPRGEREVFLRAIDLLPGLMAYAGKKGYEEYCSRFFRDAERWLAEHADMGRKVPLQ